MSPPDPATSNLIRAFVDGLEGSTARIVVDGHTLAVPRSLLPEGVKEGEWVAITVERIAGPPNDTEGRRVRLGSDDPGGDIKL